LVFEREMHECIFRLLNSLATQIIREAVLTALQRSRLPADS